MPHACRPVPGLPNSITMLQCLRTRLTSIPSITVVGVFSAYPLLGFFVLPAVLKWQLEKQLAERGHTLRAGNVHFDPLRLKLEVDQLALADASGAPMLGFDHLMVDLEWRSITEQSWTLAAVRLLGPTLRVSRAKDGSHNFSNLIAQFSSAETTQGQQDATVPPVHLLHAVLRGGSIEWLDQMLEQPRAWYR